MKTELLHHWWIYPLAIYYLTWLITYQTVLHQHIWRKGGSFGDIPKHLQFCLRRIIRRKYMFMEDILISFFIGIWIIICVASWIFLWAISFVLGFVPIFNHIVSGFKTFEDEKGESFFLFESANYKETFIIRGWIYIFELLFLGIDKALSIRFRKPLEN